MHWLFDCAFKYACVVNMSPHFVESSGISMAFPAAGGVIGSASQIQGAEGARTYQPSAQRWDLDCQKRKGWKPAPYTAIEIWFLMDRAFSPLILFPSRTQRCALGWYEIAPLALESMDSF
jgi:hypothetical protein